MNSSWLYRQDPLWIVITLVVAMAVAAEIGFQFGRRWYARVDEPRRGQVGVILGSVLGLLALLLSFTFAMSTSRYETRRGLVVSDANALGALYLQSSLLPDPPRKEFKRLLELYIDLRTPTAILPGGGGAADAIVQAVAKSDDIRGQMWKLIADLSVHDPSSKTADAMLKGLVEISSIQRERLFAYEGHVPDSVICLLLLGATTAMGAMGLSYGLSGNHRGMPARLIVTVLLCGTIYVILDLDRPTHGLTRVSQSPMLHVRQAIDRDPEMKP